jgi:nucleotide sugar dehydrogenase
MIYGIIGNGFVGKAVRQYKCEDNELLIYDVNPELCEPYGTKLEDLKICDIIFICVPTPMNKNGSCHTDIVKSVVQNIKNTLGSTDNIIIKSTIPVGVSDELECNFSPEFLTEKNYICDFVNCEDWIFGLFNPTNKIKTNIRQLINNAYINSKIKYNKIHFMLNKEAEMIKYFRNTFLATKVSFCNEIEEFCKHKNVDYNTVSELATLDKRISRGHTHVPGHDGKRGFGGTCFPKDCNALKYEMDKVNMKSYILSSVLDRNNKIDRPEEDWKDDVGRAII